MELLIFKTDIENEKTMHKLGMHFSSLSKIRSWTLDIEDADKVLKVHIHEALDLAEVQSLVKSYGFACEELE